MTVNVCDDPDPIMTSPKLTAVELSFNAEDCAGDREMLNVLEYPPAVAVMTAVCGVVTAEIIAVNGAFKLPLLTVTP